MKTGNFFRVDRRTWAAVCELGMNPAVAYLVLSQGTDANNRLTNWSVTALKTHAGISWERGKQAIEGLIHNGFLRHTKGHTTARPRYQLAAWQEILTFRAARVQVDDGYSWMVFQEIKAGKQPSTKAARGAAETLARSGLVEKSSDGKCRNLLQTDLDPAEEYIWLPNTLVTGTDRGRNPLFVGCAAPEIFGLCACLWIYTTPRISAMMVASVLELSVECTSGSQWEIRGSSRCGHSSKPI